MLSLPDDWDYTVAGLVTLSSDGKDSVNSALKELEKFGYLTRTRLTDARGRFAGIEYNIYENPIADNPISAKPIQDKPISEKQPQSNTNSIKDLSNKLFMELNTNDEELIAAYQDYIIMREEMNAPLNEMSLGKLIARAKRLSNNNVRVEKVLLETAVINNWKNVYPPRESELERLSADMRDEMKDLFGL